MVKFERYDNGWRLLLFPGAELPAYCVYRRIYKIALRWLHREASISVKTRNGERTLAVQL